MTDLNQQDRAEVLEMLRGPIVNDFGAEGLLRGDEIPFSLDDLAEVVKLARRQHGSAAQAVAPDGYISRATVEFIKSGECCGAAIYPESRHEWDQPIYLATPPVADTEGVKDVLKLALQQLEEWEIVIDSEWGPCRDLDELERDGELSKATLEVRATLSRLNGEKK